MKKSITLAAVLALLGVLLVTLPGRKETPAAISATTDPTSTVPGEKEEPGFNPSALITLALQGNEPAVAQSLQRFSGQAATRVQASIVRVQIFEATKQSYTMSSEGLGVVVGGDVILTSCPGVDVAAKIILISRNGIRAEGGFITADPGTGISVLKSDRPFSNAAPMANVDELEAGQTLIAIGWDPLLEQKAVTLATLAGLGWTWLPPRQYAAQILTIQGGGTSNQHLLFFTPKGELAGIQGNDWALEDEAGRFRALASDQLSWILTQATTNGEIRRGAAGFVVKEITTVTKDSSSSGVAVSWVDPTSPAAKAGLRVGDILVSVEGTPVRTAQDAISQLGRAVKGQAIAVEIISKQGTTKLSIMAE